MKARCYLYPVLGGIFILSIVILLLTPCYADEEIVIFASDDDAPWVAMNSDGKAEGVVVDMLNYIQVNTPYKFKYKLAPWKRAYKLAELGKGAAIGVSKNTRRLEIFEYSDMLYSHDLFVVVKKGNEFNFDTFQDLKGKTVAVLRGASYTDEYSRTLKAGIFTTFETNNREQRIRMLLSEHVDAAIIGGGLLGISIFMNRFSDLKGKIDQISVLPKPLLRDPNYLVISKKLNATSFIKVFNKALKAGNESGEFDKFKERYMKKAMNHK